jgi:DNA polymerase-3 subunit alpha (Gram-positive type)
MKARPGRFPPVCHTVWEDDSKRENTPLAELNQESGRVTVLGRIFAVDTRDIRNNTLMVISFDITDDTGSVRVSSVLKAEEGKKLKDLLKVGGVVRVRGEVEFNRFEKDIAIRPYDINEVEQVSVIDDAPEKRVELHLHTTMSSMDGMTPVEEYIKRAAQWGHEAIAVTDHGVVQAFPEAMSAGKKFGVKIFTAWRLTLSTIRYRRYSAGHAVALR